MMVKDSEIAIVFIATLLVIGLLVGFNLAITFLAVWVAWGFGYELPFFPTLGGIILLQVIGATLRGVLSR